MKAQELPLAAIVVVTFGIVVLFLVLIFIFKINPLAAIINILRPGPSKELEVFAKQCETYCIQANQSYHPISNSCPLFCSITYNTTPFKGIDKDHCYPESGDVVKVDCSIIGQDGNTYTLNSTNCKCI